MISTFNSARFYQKVTCVSGAKVLTARYSANVPKPKRKDLDLKEIPYMTVPEGYQSHTIIIKSAKVALPLDIINKHSNLNKVNQTIVNESTKFDQKVSKEHEWKLIETDISKLYKHCLMLSKIRLTSLVVVTTMGGYILAPGIFDPQTFLMCSIGIGLVSATANAINQFFEVPFDAQMSRTKNRVLVRGHLTPAQVIAFATVSGVVGLSTLYFQVNELTGTLGVANLFLYTLIYTPMKRVSILNTWIGSIVGAIPPLMGWAGCTGDILSPGAWIISGMLYAWQFPHFNALSWNLRPDYSRAGYRMMAVTNPDLCRRTALRYTGALIALSYLAPIYDITDWWFAIASTPLNAYFFYLAWKFNRNSDSRSSRKLFRFSLIHLPTLMILMLLSKKHWFNTKDKKDVILTSNKNQENIFAIITKPFVALAEKL